MDKKMVLERLDDNKYRLDAEGLVIADVINAAGYLLHYATFALTNKDDLTRRDREYIIRYTMRAIEEALVDNLDDIAEEDNLFVN